MSSLELEVSKVVERAVELIVVSSSVLAMRLVSVFTQKTRNHSHLPFIYFILKLPLRPPPRGVTCQECESDQSRSAAVT